MALDSNSGLSLGRRKLLQLTTAGAGIAGIDNVTATPDEDFVDIVGTNPTDYPNIGINVNVDTEAGRNGDLTADNFTIYENGAEKKIKEFSFADTALDIVFVFDDSGSMGGEISTMKREAKSLTSSIADKGIDAQYGLVSFRDTVDQDLPLTSDSTQLKDAVDNLDAWGGGDFPEDNFDAIETALSMDFRSEARTIIVDITDATAHYDGDGSGYSDYTLEEVASDLREQGAVFVGVSGGYDDPKASLKVLANKSGGKWYDINSANFDDILNNIIELLIDIYYIEYTTENPPDTEQNVSVGVEDPNRGKDRAEGVVDIPSGDGLTSKERFKRYRQAKIGMAQHLDSIGNGINEEPIVRDTLDTLSQKVDNEGIEAEKAESATKRMLLGEDLTELTLGVVNPVRISSTSEIGYDNLDSYSYKYEPSSSPATNEDARLSFDMVSSGLSMGTALFLGLKGITRLASYVGYNASKVTKHIDEAISIVVGIPGISGKMTDVSNDIANEQDSDLADETKSADEATDDILEEVDVVGESLAKSFSKFAFEGGLQSNLERFDEKLGTDGGGISAEGSDTDAEKGWQDAREEIVSQYDRTDNRLSVADAFSKAGDIVAVAGAALSVTGVFTAVGVFATVVGLFFSISFNFLKILSSSDGIYRIRGIHNAGLDSIVGGETYVDY